MIPIDVNYKIFSDLRSACKQAVNKCHPTHLIATENSIMQDTKFFGNIFNRNVLTRQPGEPGTTYFV